MVYQALLDEICDGSLPIGAHLVQDELAEQLGVSRQPVQQAIVRLKSEGLLEDAPGRGVRVPNLDLPKMQEHYQIRLLLDRLAARLSAQRAADSKSFAEKMASEGADIIAAGKKAVERHSVVDMIHHDVAFHGFIYECSGNSQIAPTVEIHWRFLRRVMGDVLRSAVEPESIWQQHQGILEAIVSGDVEQAEILASSHIEKASDALITIFKAGS